MTNKKPHDTHQARRRNTFTTRILPPLAGLAAMFAVLGLLNSQHITSRLQAWTYSPEPSERIQLKDKETEQQQPDPSAPSTIIINGIKVVAPVIYGLQTTDESVFQKALENGVAHYPNTALPGQSGNVVIFGHSSGQVWAPGNYKSIFALLEKLQTGDKIFLDYQGIRYTYEVVTLKVVTPTDISVLQPTPDPTLTLITCTPVGTNTNRLIVTAKQISPLPSEREASPTHSPSAPMQTLPGNTPSFLKTIQSIFN